jgi:DNA-binding GntR family transcriptional regulator
MVNHLPRVRPIAYGGRRPANRRTVSTSAPSGAVPESRREWILRWLRHAIATGELEPGERLVERDISARSGVSRGPVREAIMILEQEGLVVSHPYRGAQVAPVSADEVREVLVPIRQTIERFAFRNAAALPDLLGRLEGIVRDMESAARRGDADRLADLDVDFHEAVIRAAGHPQTLQIWRTIQPRVRAYFVRDAPAHPSPDEIPRQHRELLEALRTGDPATVDRAVTEHIALHLAR